MPLMLRSSALIAGFIALVAAGSSAAQQHMDRHEARSAAPFRPGFGALMTAFVQPRHIKLGLAGAEKNWPYAAYELAELAEAFDDIAKLVPKHGSLAVPAAIASTVKQPMAALDNAIKAEDADAFTRAYADLTSGCNACHQSADHPMIVIQVPTVSTFPDQQFAPSGK